MLLRVIRGSERQPTADVAELEEGVLPDENAAYTAFTYVGCSRTKALLHRVNALLLSPCADVKHTVYGTYVIGTLSCIGRASVRMAWPSRVQLPSSLLF